MNKQYNVKFDGRVIEVTAKNISEARELAFNVYHCNKMGNRTLSDMKLTSVIVEKLADKYQGWTNSATWSCAYLVQQEMVAYEALTAIRKAGKQVSADDVKNQFNRLNLKKDSWTMGKVNWQEIADTDYNNEEYTVD